MLILLDVNNRRFAKMEEEEKQKLLSLHKELEGVRSEIQRGLAAIKGGIFDIDKATKRGDIIRGLKQKEKEIIKKIQDITKEEKV